MQTDSSADQLELQKLEEQRRELDRRIAQLKSTTTTAAPSFPLSPLSPSPSCQPSDAQGPQPTTQVSAHHARRQSAARPAASPAVIPATRAFPDDEMESHPMKRAKTTYVQPTSTRESVPMDRSSSTRPTSSIPFSGTGMVTPPPVPQSVQQHYRHGSMIENYSRDAHQAPISESLFSHSMQIDGTYASQPTTLTGFTGGPVAPDVGMDIEDYLQAFGNGLTDTYVHFDTPDMQQNADVIAQQMPVSICGSLTTAPTLEDFSMSRRNSIIPNDGSSVMGQLPVGMIRLASQSSFEDGNSPDVYNANQLLDEIPKLGKPAPPSDQQDFFQIGAGPSHAREMYPPTTVYQSTPMVHSESNQSIDIGFTQMPDYRPTDVSPSTSCEAASAGMERTQSSASSRSNQSLNLRAKEAIKRQNQNAIKAPKLQPKPLTVSDAGGTDEARDKTGVAMPSTFATPLKPGKTAITAPKKYERPKHPKVHCTKCPDQPEFRGEHELRRHTDAKHKSTASKWVCRDPRAADPTAEFEGPVPVQPLDQCKHCKGKKLYGAYYNAAAHLRRTHFKEKPVRSRNTGDKTKDDGSAKKTDAERRAGHGGGDWPSMDVLKSWMEEIKVKVSDSDDEKPFQCEQEATEADDEETDVEAELEDQDPELDGKDSLFYSGAPFAAHGADMEKMTHGHTSFPVVNRSLSESLTFHDLNMHNLGYLPTGFHLSSATYGGICAPLDMTAMGMPQLQSSGILSSPSTTTSTITPRNVSDCTGMNGTDGVHQSNPQLFAVKQESLGDASLVSANQCTSEEFSFEALFQQPDWN
ncbi:uncharacterized protein PpBr36_06210 [Pyricularia pennisetigena]|uniref:uncharacterized protein n=1 Tax=Pyricularia pennisetigena TaxID=1578925 RepID=UPI0011549894|nr:uncharacterized protein PpBr36_06210 [Pyricularia pennisetigena]TLS23165.1 hypothetical protein PpBr36_06210 [Pyricularia pennisetigena]